MEKIENLTLTLKEFLEAEISPFIEVTINKIINTLSGIDNTYLYMEQETICDRMLSIARKKYIGRYYTEDGKKKYKMTGVPMINNSVPPFCKEKMMDCLDLILDNKREELFDYIDTIFEEFKKQPLSNICVNTKVGSLAYEYSETLKKWKSIEGDKNAPSQSKGSIYFNNLVKNKVINSELIIPGDKVFKVMLKTPNRLVNDSIICFVNETKELRELLEKEDCIDYLALFNKNFVQSFHTMTTPIGFDYNKRLDNMIDEWA